MGSKRNQPIRTVRINRKALISSVVVAALGFGAVYWLGVYQEQRTSAEVLATAKTLGSDGKPDLAVRHLSQHLAVRPTDTAALELKSRLLFETANTYAQIHDATRAHEQFLRNNQDAPGAQDARKRLARLYIRYAEMSRTAAATQNDIVITTLESRFRAAEVVARQLVERGGNDAESHRLLAMALDGLAVPGDEKALNDAVLEYRNVLAIDPTDVEAAERLASIFQDRRKDFPRAELVLEDLLRAKPRSADVRLARYRLYAKARSDVKAAAELEAAIVIAPDDLSVIIAASEHALRRGDTAEARRQLDKVPEKSRGDIRVLMTRGLISFGDERPEDAVDAWRQGLMTSSGTNDEVTWWLAFSLLQMGRVVEAKPLLAQYQRLAGNESPLFHFLKAILDERNGMPARAIATLEQIRKQLDPRWESMIQISRGRCYEALWDEMKALESYNHALQIDPLAIVPRLAIAKIRLRHSADEAISELERGLKVIPGDPALQIGLAGAYLRKEVAQPAARRRWTEFDRAMEKARKSTPNSTAVVLMHADRLSLNGQEDDAVRYLEEVATKTPKNAQVAVALADGLSRRNLDARALEVLERASSVDAAGDHAKLRIARAKTLTALYRGREAHDILIQGVESLPIAEQPQVLIALGQLETARGDIDAAIRAYKQWADLLPNDPRPRLVLLDLAFDQNNDAKIPGLVQEIGEICGDNDVAYRLARAKELIWERDKGNPTETSRDNQLETAGQLVESVLADASELPAAQMLRAQVLERQGRLDEAINAYTHSWEHGVASALPRLIDLLTRNKKFDSLSTLRTNDKASPVQVDLLSTQAFLRQGDASQASRIAEQVARDQPDSSEAFRWQARMLELLERVEDAETALRSMAEKQPSQLEPWLALIRFQASHKRTQAVIDTLARVKTRVSTDPPELLDARCLAAAGDVPGAEKAFKAAITARPSDINLRLEAARFEEDNERPIEAEQNLNKAIELDPKNRPAIRQLAMVLSSHAADLATWERALAQLGPEGPETSAPEDRFARAVVLFRCPDTARRASVINRLKEIVADLPVAHPTAAAAREYLARIYLDAGNPVEASQLASVSASRGSDPASIALYAKALIMSKKPEAAEWQLDRLAALSPGDPREASLRARAIWDRSRPTQAAKSLEDAYSAREDIPGSNVLGREAFLLLANFGKDYNLNAERLGRKLASNNSSLSWMPALVLARSGRNDEALSLLLKAAETANFQDLIETARVAISILAVADDEVTLGKVEAVLTAAQRAEPAADEFLIMRAMLRHVQQRYLEEADDYRAALQRRPENTVILNNLAWVLSEGLHKPDEAIKYIDDLIKITGRNVQAVDTRGVILSRLGRHSEAVLELEYAVEKEPNALRYLHLARAYQLAGRTDEARASRLRAEKTGFTPKDLDPVERTELQAILKL